jgi:pilus assembly protein FimV
MFASASQITMPESESTLTVPVMELESPVTYDVGTVGESSFISDFTPSDFDAFDTDQNEIDPLSEADVYLAYGRYQQAEELIRNALNHEPGRDTYKLKLLEIYYAAENKDAFTKYSEVLAKDGKESDRGFWNKVSEMGKELVPEIALFGGAPVTAPITTVKAVNVDLLKQKTQGASTGVESLLDNDYLAALDSSLALDTAIPEDLSNEFSDLKQAFSKASNQQIDQLDFDFSSSEAKFGIADANLDEMTLKFSADSEMPEDMLVDYADYKFDSTQETAFDNDQDSDLAALTNDSESRKPAAIEPMANNEAIDFDLSSFSFESRTEHTKDTDHDLEMGAFNFNFDIDEIGKSSNKEVSEIIVTPETPNLEIADNHNLSVNSTFEPDISALHAMKPEALEEDSFSEFDFSFDFDTPLENKDSEFSKDSEFFDLNVSDLTDMDEFETKIDLAKAYVDMGDASAAKVIAEEVLGKGTRDQKLAAQALLDELR